MNRFDRLFAERREACIPFLVLGDPDFETSERLMRAAVDAGADALELGIPFSDPIADGPTIRRAVERSLRAGATVERCFDLLARVRSGTDVPIGVLTYFNLVRRPGVGRFAERLAASGVDAVVTADLPLDESAETEEAFAKCGVGFVHFVAPNTPLDRARLLIERSTAFTYVLGVYGITGARAALSDTIADRIGSLRKISDKPLVVGFGISEPAHARTLFDAGANGVIMGSALVERLERAGGDADEMERVVRSFVGRFAKERNPSTCSS